MTKYPTDFIDNDYVIIRQAISPDVCELLAEYARFKAKLKPNVKKNDDPLQGIHREYNDALMETLLNKLTPLVEQATERSLWPTLSFYYTYANGNYLKKHVDRSSCEFVAGLCIGADDAFQTTHKTWPLMLNVRQKTVSIELNAGDLVIFRGHQTEHWRDVFQGEWFVSAIFAYVEKTGPYAFQKYDQRRTLGKPHVGMFRWLAGCLINNLKQRFN